MPTTISGDTGVSAVQNGAVDLTTDVSGVLPVANGGNGTATANASFKNRIINGAMMIDQRNAGASVNTDGAFPVDRWKQNMSGGGVITGQRSTVVPAGFINSLSQTVSTADSSIASSDYYYLTHNIEGFNVADLGWGTANAQSITISFQVRSSVTGTYAIAIGNSAFNRLYVTTYTINSANTYETKTVTIAGDTSGTWLTDNGIGLRVYFDLGSGSAYNASTGNSWLGSGVGIRLSSTVNWISNSGATFYITGVQLEKGSTATSFDYRPYGTELALCQRYYAKVFSSIRATAVTTGTGQIGTHFTFKTSMRATPTMSNYTAGSVDNSTSLDAFYGASTEGCGVSINCGAGNIYAFGVSAIASVEL